MFAAHHLHSVNNDASQHVPGHMLLQDPLGKVRKQRASKINVALPRPAATQGAAEEKFVPGLQEVQELLASGCNLVSSSKGNSAGSKSMPSRRTSARLEEGGTKAMPEASQESLTVTLRGLSLKESHVTLSSSNQPTN